MIDLHVHLLPGVDDGPSTWDEAVAMVRMAAAEGVTAMAATSHMVPGGVYPNTRERLLTLVAELQRRVAESGIEMEIYPGAEVYMTADVAELAARSELLTYCDAGRYMLLEMPTSEIPPYAVQVIDDLRLQGIIPIIAHPERNLDIISEPSRAAELVERGALLQVTASSLKAVQPVRAATRFLLRHGLVHFLASDAHGAYNRRPRLGSYLGLAKEWLDTATVQQMVEHNPAAVLEGRTLDPHRHPPRALGARRFWQTVMQRLTVR